MDTIKFMDQEHRDFFEHYMFKCRKLDAYHTALVYCLGISGDTRNHIDVIYDFKTDCIKPECLHDGWMTSGSSRIVRMAFNLYTNATLGAEEDDDIDTQLQMCSSYAVDELFCCSYAKYFWEAIKIRYPEYCY